MTKFRRRTLCLALAQRQELEGVRDTAPQPYVRERAAALLKIAAGQAPYAVARRGLLKARKPDTLYGWLTAFEHRGIASLVQLPRPGKRGFSPAQAAAIQEQLRQPPPPDPQTPGPAPTRWSLAYLQRHVPAFRDYTLAGIWYALRRWRITYRRGRHAVHSPDPQYGAKRAYAQQCVQAARAQPERVVALYLDELSYYRQPSLASGWWQDPWGADQPLGRLSHRSNTVGRVVGALDAVTGQVVAQQGSKIGVAQLVRFYQELRARYPHAEQIRVIQDNWPVHFHPEVRAAAQAARIEMVPLPTYAPWLNPIEKLWRKLKQELLHLHRLSDQWAELQARVRAFLERFAAGSKALLHYVGLLPELLPD